MDSSRSALGRAIIKAQESASEGQAGNLTTVRALPLVTHLRHWLCTAAMVLMTVLASIKALI
jgi:hypothetical protein